MKLKVHEHDPIDVIGQETRGYPCAHLPPCLFYISCTTATYATTTTPCSVTSADASYASHELIVRATMVSITLHVCQVELKEKELKEKELKEKELKCFVTTS